MRCRFSISFIWFSAIVTLVCTERLATSIDDVFQSDQILFLAQQDCYRYLETSVPPGECPQVVTSMDRLKISYRYVGVHLLRDLKGIQPPKIITVAENEVIFSIQVLPLNVSMAFGNGSRKVLENISETNTLSYHRRFGVRGKSTNGKTIHSVFDTTTSMLYLDYSTSNFYSMEQFFVFNAFSENPEVKSMAKKQGKVFKRRYDFVEDPYSGVFYYKEDINNQTLYFKAELGDIFEIVSGALNGKQVNDLSIYKNLFGVSRGTFFGTDVKKEKDELLSFRFLNSEKSKQWNCTIQTDPENMPQSNKLIIIRDNEYCMLRDGVNYNKKECEDKRKQYLDAGKDEEFNILIWLSIFCIILLVIVILLCIYVYWLRTSFITVDDQIAQNEQETEASLFIAKQRSFPTSYQDPALLDISVDRWN
ncbi:unnamed protein product [Caenorhabditis brenneri]